MHLDLTQRPDDLPSRFQVQLGEPAHHLGPSRKRCLPPCALAGEHWQLVRQEASERLLTEEAVDLLVKLLTVALDGLEFPQQVLACLGLGIVYGAVGTLLSESVLRSARRHATLALT